MRDRKGGKGKDRKGGRGGERKGGRGGERKGGRERGKEGRGRGGERKWPLSSLKPKTETPPMHVVNFTQLHARRRAGWAGRKGDPLVVPTTIALFFTL